MKSKSRKVLLYISAVIMIVFSVTVGNKAGEENRKETRLSNANAAEVGSAFDVYDAGGEGYSVYGDMDYSADAEIEDMEINGSDDNTQKASETDAIKSLAEQSSDMMLGSDEISKKISEMSIEDKVAQLFIITPDIE